MNYEYWYDDPEIAKATEDRLEKECEQALRAKMDLG